MEINKTYNIEQLEETLQQAIELTKKYDGIVKLDFLTAYDILEVLKEIHKREQKHQTLESALTFIEKEDGTKTNLLEESKQTCPYSCFGNYGEEDDWEDDCDECMYAKECKKLYEQRGKNNE